MNNTQFGKREDGYIPANKLKIALVIGHSVNEQGACSNHYKLTEFALNNIVANRIATKCDVDVIYRKNCVLSTVMGLNHNNYDLAIEFHCNAHNEKTNGLEVLYCKGSIMGATFAEMFRKHAAIALETRNRGTKPVSRHGRGGAFLHVTEMPAIIIESFFIDNDLDTKNFFNKMDKFVDSIAMCVNLLNV